MKWKKRSPEPPEVAPSDWYWFIGEETNEMEVIEVWPGRYLKHLKGRWGDRIPRPEEKE